MKEIARELLVIADSLLRYTESTEKLGDLVKKKFRGYPWKYNSRAKAWVITGERNVERFYEQENFHEGADATRESIIRKLGRRFDGYLIMVDTQDSYILITLD